MSERYEVRRVEWFEGEIVDATVVDTLQNVVVDYFAEPDGGVDAAEYLAEELNREVKE